MKISEQKSLLSWFRSNKRPFPWRLSTAPYGVWISEVMLQQTTSTAVIPYYEKFMRRFPTLKSLANSQLEDVYEHWSGLGYYSRARNLHKCAKLILENHGGRFPKNHNELIKLPGFGPYTSRAVSSISYQEPAGVLDGNVIRVMSRLRNEKYEWWTPKIRMQMQQIADQWVSGVSSAEMNQALMELGSTICIPKNPKCILCPLMKSCQAQKAHTWSELPLKKPKRQKEIWLWTAQIRNRADKVFLIRNEYAPFLKNSWLPEGKAQQIKEQPESFDFRHTITHHNIFVRIENIKANMKTSDKGEWVPFSESRKHAPAALVQKAIQHVLDSKA